MPKSSFFLKLYLSLLLGLGFLSSSYSLNTIPQTRHYTSPGFEYSSTAYDVHQYDLSIEINIKKKFLNGRCTMIATSTESISTLTIDLWYNWVIDSVIHNNKTCAIQRDSSNFQVLLKEEIKAKSLFKINIYYHGIPKEAKLPPWEDGIVWKTDSLLRPWIGMTCEGSGASLWWPCKDRVTDEADSITATFMIDKGLQCISNGILQNHSSVNGKEIFTWKTSYPMNNYNLTFNIGSYVNFKDSLLLPSGKMLQLDFYAMDYHLLQAKQHFQQSKKVIYDFSKLFGDYPFIKDHYKLIETTYRGMEHQSAISYGNDFKNDVLDFDFIIIHETAHEWWGNSITAYDHGELWIHETFATYSEALFIELNYGKESYQKYLDMQKTYIKNKTPMLGPSGVYYNNWKDNDIYYKGAWMLHTLRNLIANDSLWFNLLKEISSNFKISVVNSKVLIDYINIKTGSNYSSFFHCYLTQASPPALQYYLKKKKENYILFYRWNNSIPNFDMPFEIKINNKVKRIYPDDKFKHLSIPIKEPSDLEFMVSKMYVIIEKIK